MNNLDRQSAHDDGFRYLGDVEHMQETEACTNVSGAGLDWVEQCLENTMN